MSYFLFLIHGLTLALVWFLGVNGAATLLVFSIAGRVTRQGQVRTPGFWFGLRLLPAAASIGLVAAVFLPSYWTYEPRDYAEGFDVTLAAAALVALVVGVCAVARGTAALAQASNRARAWRQIGHPLTLAGTTMRAFEIDADAPIVALVGVLRPRLFLTRNVLGALTGEELAASVAHELGHWRALDNLKRLAMRAAPDLLGMTSVASDLERRWATASEHVADRDACERVSVADRARVRCALASAIVKVARMTPSMAPTAEPISTLVAGGDIASRVRSLLDDGTPPVVATPRSRRLRVGVVVAAAAVAFGYVPLLRTVHLATEILVRTLP
jgi:beta-lactamase regulating signal transducer with metallopeptidase domain